MTRVCIVGDDEVDLRYELLSRETSREALSTYDLAEPWANCLAVETISLGAAVALLNDLDWYLIRFADESLVLEPSVSETEWLSRKLARRVRDDRVPPEETDEYLKVYGVVDRETDDEAGAVTAGRELVEPMFLTRVDGEIPEYDLRDVEDTVVVRVTGAEFGQ